MEPSMQPPINPFQPSPSPTPPSVKKRGWLLWVIVAAMAAIVIAGVVLVLALSLNNAKQANLGNTQVDAASKLLGALANASGQQKIHVGMYRATYVSKSDADANTNSTSQQSTVSELDNAAADYRSVYAYKFPTQTVFSVGRCVTGKDYRNFADTIAQKPTSLQVASAKLATGLQLATEHLSFSPCPQVGLYPGASPETASARLSDGFFPVTLTQAQAANWQAKVKAANLFDFKDDGMVAKDGKQLHKISFAPKSIVTDVNQKLLAIFDDAAEIAHAKTDPRAIYAYEFVSIGAANHGSIGGYYLLDDKTNLPVYSELYGTGLDDGNSIPNNWAKTKQNYAFPSSLSMTNTTALEFLQ